MALFRGKIKNSKSLKDLLHFGCGGKTRTYDLRVMRLCQWVFNSNCSFIIEMIDKEHHNNSSEPWYKLIELTAGIY